MATFFFNIFKFKIQSIIIFIFFLVFITLIDDNLLLLLNLVFVLYSIFIFLGDFINSFLIDEIHLIYSKYVYYYEINIQYLVRLHNLYNTRLNDFEESYLKLYFILISFMKVNFVKFILSCMYINLKRIEYFLFNFLENEIIFKKLKSLLILSTHFEIIKSNIKNCELLNEKPRPIRKRSKIK